MINLLRIYQLRSLEISEIKKTKFQKNESRSSKSEEEVTVLRFGKIQNWSKLFVLVFTRLGKSKAGLISLQVEQWLALLHIFNRPSLRVIRNESEQLRHVSSPVKAKLQLQLATCEWAETWCALWENWWKDGHALMMSKNLEVSAYVLSDYQI